ncbi:hypothetical protein KC336_g20103, partial [Hortaea werneckii]
MEGNYSFNTSNYDGGHYPNASTYDTLPQVPETIDPALLSFNTPNQAPQYPYSVFCSTCGQQHPDQASLTSHGHWVHMVEASLDCASTGCEFCSFVVMDPGDNGADLQNYELQQSAGGEEIYGPLQMESGFNGESQNQGEPFFPYGFAGDPSAQTIGGAFAEQQVQLDANAVWSPSSSMNYYNAPIVPSIEQPSSPPQPSKAP